LHGAPLSATSEAERSIVHDLWLVYEVPGEGSWATVEMRNVDLSASQLESLRTVVMDWTSQPLESLGQERFVHLAELSARPNQSLKLDFGSSDTLVLPKGGVSCTVGMRIDFLHAELTFATDPSALLSFADGLIRLRDRYVL
jgi:hypothetical protein